MEREGVETIKICIDVEKSKDVAVRAQSALEHTTYLRKELSGANSY